MQHIEEMRLGKGTKNLWRTKDTTSPNFLVFLRIGVGLLVLINFFSFYTDIPYLYGNKAFMPNEVANIYVNELQITNYKILQYTGMEYDQFWVVFTLLFVLFALLLSLGLFTQLTALALLVLHGALFKTSSFFAYGGDYYVRICLFMLCVLPSNVQYALDARFFKSTMEKVKQVVHFGRLRLLIKIFVGISYFFSGFDKLLGFNWHNGEAIWKTITLPYSNLDFNIAVTWLVDYQWLLIFIGWSVIVLELFYFLINFKKLQKFWLWSIIGMHLGIALILNLYFFSAIMIILNLTAYYDFSDDIAYSQEENVIKDV